MNTMPAVRLYVLAASIAVALSASALFLGRSDSFSGLAKTPAVLLGFFPGVTSLSFDSANHNADLQYRQRSLTQTTGLQQINILFVLDPNFFLCWESIAIDDSVKSGFLKWLTTLKDPFAAVAGTPKTPDLEIPAGHGRARELRGSELETFKQLAEDAILHGNESIPMPSNMVLMYQAVTSNSTLAQLGLVDAYHPAAHQTLHLSPKRLSVTSEDNFWSMLLHVYNMTQQAAERVTGGGATGNYCCSLGLNPANASLAHQDPVGLEDTVIILPRVVPQVHSLEPLRIEPEDSIAWEVPHLAALVDTFCRETGATTIPSVQEWTVLPDKRRLHSMYQSYFEEDPAHRTPPIPTIFLTPPGSKEELMTLCHPNIIKSSEVHLDATMRRIYEGIIELEEELHRVQQQFNVKVRELSRTSNSSEEGFLRHYVIKREYAEGSMSVTKLEFPGAALPAPGQLAPMLYKGDQPWRARPPLPEEVDAAVKGGSLLTTDPYLLRAAEKLVYRGCGEGWLLQPEIRNMSALEYRVYLFGGAQSKGTSEDAVVVYTPAILDEGIYLANLTIPEGHIWSDVITPPGELEADKNQTEQLWAEGKSRLHWDRRPWWMPKLHQKIVNAALSGARAIAAFEGGRLSTVANMYARMDVVLGLYWKEDGRMYVQPLINEMDWFNSAGVMMRYWPVNASAEAAAAAAGPKMVPHFLREVVLTYEATRREQTLVEA